MVKYNQSMAVGLRHNIDTSPTLTRKKGLALVRYIGNYASKLNAPMWKRLAYAEELLDLARQQQGETDDPGVLSSMREATKSPSYESQIEFTRAENSHSPLGRRGEGSCFTISTP